jgi:2-dehydropantoate 2-reductase
MRILDYGTRIQGSLYGARLHEAGHEVALLARGSRLANPHAHGVILEDLTTNRRTVTPVPMVDELAPGDTYDLAMVPVRREQVAEVLPPLAAAVRVPTVPLYAQSRRRHGTVDRRRRTRTSPFGLSRR